MAEGSTVNECNKKVLLSVLKLLMTRIMFLVWLVSAMQEEKRKLRVQVGYTMFLALIFLFLMGLHDMEQFKKN